MSDNMKYITIEDFSDNYKEVVEIVGIEKALELSLQFGGTLLYIPKLDDLHRKVRNAKIKTEFNGSNIAELARKYELTDIQIRSILRTKEISIKETSIEDFIEKED